MDVFGEERAARERAIRTVGARMTALERAIDV